MKALLIIAHGSRKLESNDEIHGLIDNIRGSITGYDLVDCAFLELAKPDISQGGIQLIEAGATSINILPYFLVAGNHVTTDIPSEVSNFSARFPHVDVSIDSYFGSIPGVVELLVEHLNPGT